MAGVRHRISPASFSSSFSFASSSAPDSSFSSCSALVTAIYLSFASLYDYSKGFNTSADLLPLLLDSRGRPYAREVDSLDKSSSRLDSFMYPREII